MTSEEISSVVSKAVKDAIHIELGEYKVPKEQHYKDHVFLQLFQTWVGDTKNIIWRTILKTVIGFLVLFLIGLFIFFIGGKQ